MKMNMAITKSWPKRSADLNISFSEEYPTKNSKEKTGEFKFSKPFRRTVFEYNHGIVCSCCRKAEIITSFSPKTPKYCSEVCRQKVKRTQASAYYYQKKEQFRRID